MLNDIKKALVFVESPFQVTNMLDLAEYQPLIQFNVFVRLNGDKKNDDAIRRLVKTNRQRNVSVCLIKISRSGKTKFAELLKLFLYVPMVLSATHVIFFDDRSLVYKAFNRLVRGSILLADDGAYSFSKITKLEKERDGRIVGFITRFDVLSSNYVDIIYLPYKKVRLKTDNYSIVVGMPLFEKGIISKKSHLEMIRKITGRLSEITGNEVYYFPHRSECAYRELGLKVVESELSIEEYVEDMSDMAPSHVASLYSTALFVLSSKFEGLQFFYYRVPDCLIDDNNHARNIGMVYEALERSKCKELL